jgi:hypothetical protein
MTLIYEYLQLGRLARNIYIFILLIPLVSGCITTKLITKENPEFAYLSNSLLFCQAKNLEYHLFSANTVEVVFNLQGKEYRSEAVMKMIKDTALQVSVLPVMGVESYRFLMDNDSILIIDRFNRKAYTTGFKAVIAIMGNYFKLGSIQDLLVGNLPELHANDSTRLISTINEFDSYRVFNTEFNLNSEIFLESLVYIVNTDIGKLVKLELTSSKGKVEIEYSGFRKYRKWQIPAIVDISLVAKDGLKTRINLKYSDLKDKATILGRAHAPKGYKLINWNVF